ncbi:MAG: nucleoside 2-deoxyribosyltransferase [Nanoarchaeota archaeon]|nr:nucleoside 2-deoxyribosyltransferase [Nanoarchaeota archaeon]MBU4086788.1 nucleoside 2-deoxyribosyltransferase [Nanoarchaeota archaeon]
MRIQLAYRFIGENEEELTEMLKKICSIIGKSGNEVYCPALDSKKPKEKKYLFLNTLDKINESDALLAIIRTEDKSEGMLMEIGHALAEKKIFILAIQKDLRNTHMREFADKVIEFEDTNDLYDNLGKLKF